MLAGLFGLMALVAKLYPDIPIGRDIHCWLVETPLNLAHRLERRHLILMAVILCTGQVAVAIGPELALAYAVDLSLYVDAVLVTAFATASARLKAVWWSFRVRFGPSRNVARGSRPRARTPRPSRSRPAKPSNDDDDPAWPAAMCAA